VVPFYDERIYLVLFGPTGSHLLAKMSNRENVGVNSGDYRGPFPPRSATNNDKDHLAMLPTFNTEVAACTACVGPGSVRPQVNVEEGAVTIALRAPSVLARHQAARRHGFPAGHLWDFILVMGFLEWIVPLLTWRVVEASILFPELAPSM